MATVVILLFFTILLLHNSWLYSIWGGYDKDLHMAYARILTFENRIPAYEETPESYNPPLFYFLSGRLAQLFTPAFGGDFIEALKSWQLLMAFLVPLAGWLWYDIFRRLNLSKPCFAYLFLIWLLSLPVLNKMVPMYNLETTQFVLAALVAWFFIRHVLPRPKLGRIIILGLLGGLILSLRLMSFTLLLSLGLILIFMSRVKKISFATMVKFNLTLTIITLVVSGQYYFFYKDNGAFGEKMEDMRQIAWWKRQPKTFYTDTFFRTMMRTPIRPNFPNRFMPIFYSDFWGDYWNYFPQQRFGLTIDQLRKNRELINPERLNRLTWQNKVNLIPMVIIFVSFAGYLLTYFKNIFSVKKLTETAVGETFLATFFIITFLAFFYMNHKFANLYKGDTIKASYLLYSLPVLIYFAVKKLSQIQKKIILYPLLVAVIIAIGFNLEFNFF